MSIEVVSKEGLLLELLRKGASLYEIEREMGLSPAEVVRSILSLGDEAPRKIPKVDMYIYLHERGLSREEVMEAMGIDKDKYYDFRVRAIERRGYRLPKKKVTRVQELIRYLREGLDIDEIAERMGIERFSVLQIVSRAKREGLVETSGKGKTYRVFLTEEGEKLAV